MRIDEFEASLRGRTTTEGGVFRRADFHVHCPTEPGYEYRDPDAVERLGLAMASAGYAFAVVVNHCRMPDRQTLKNLGAYCPETTLVPGAEINLLVDTLDKKVEKDHFFHCLVAVNPQDDVDYDFLLHEARHKLLVRKSESGAEGFASNVAEVGMFFQENGAIFLPAHLHQSKSPAASRSIDDIYTDTEFLRFVEEGAFSALEVREASTATFFDGTHRTQAGLLIPGISCVRSSDAHHHKHIAERKRCTWVKTENRTFRELRAALAFRDRTRLNVPDSAASRVIGIHISGQFIRDEWGRFNDAMNCLIGCKGSGKTAILECLRFVLGAQVPAKRQEDVKKHVAHILGSSGFVSTLVRDASGRRMLLTRRADSPDRLVVEPEGGAPFEAADAQEAGFRVSLLGWHEIEGVADEPSARIALMDRIGIQREVQELYTRIAHQVETARDQLPAFQRKLKQLDTQLKQRDVLRKKRSTLEKLEKGKLTGLQSDYEAFLACEQRLTALAKTLAKADQESRAALDTVFGAFVDDLAAATTYPERLRQIVENTKAQHGALRDAHGKAAEQLKQALEGISTRVAELVTAARREFSVFRIETYDPQVNSLPSAEREILTRQIQIIEETKSLPEVETQSIALGQEVRQLAEGILGVCVDVCEARDEICRLREDVATRINDAGCGTHAKFLRSSNRGRREKYISTYGVEGRELVSYLDGFGGPDSYRGLRDLFQRYAALNVEAQDFKIREMLWDARFVEFLSVLDDDDVELSLDLPGNRRATIQNVSAGQRCTAVFPLLLMISEGPLIIDQPEDNLDNRHIADVIAPQFISKKASQQFILTSHNANLVVLTDSELILHVESDGTTGGVAQAGFLACPESKVKKAVLEVLDGGEQALLSRKRKYGI